MPAIKPRTTQKHLVRHITRLYRENNETLFSYAAFIGESTEHVLNQLVETVLAKDRDFMAWRTDHAGTHVPKPGSRRNGRARPFAAAMPERAQGPAMAAGRTASNGAPWSAERWSFARRLTWLLPPPSVLSACGSGRFPLTTPFWRSSTRESPGSSTVWRTCTPRCGSPRRSSGSP